MRHIALLVMQADERMKLLSGLGNGLMASPSLNVNCVKDLREADTAGSGWPQVR